MNCQQYELSYELSTVWTVIFIVTWLSHLLVWQSCDYLFVWQFMWLPVGVTCQFMWLPVGVTVHVVTCRCDSSCVYLLVWQVWFGSRVTWTTVWHVTCCYTSWVNSWTSQTSPTGAPSVTAPSDISTPRPTWSERESSKHILHSCMNLLVGVLSKVELNKQQMFCIRGRHYMKYVVTH